jgi:hypothetical protein
MKSFLVGLGIGIGLGVLFAPTSGEQTRSNIRDRANDLADSARETLEQGRERVSALCAPRRKPPRERRAAVPWAAPELPSDHRSNLRALPTAGETVCLAAPFVEKLWPFTPTANL